MFKTLYSTFTIHKK